MLASIVLSVAIQSFIIKGKITTFWPFLVGFGLFGWVTFGLLKVAGGLRDSREPKNKGYNLAFRVQRAYGNSRKTLRDQVSNHFQAQGCHNPGLSLVFLLRSAAVSNWPLKLVLLVKPFSFYASDRKQKQKNTNNNIRPQLFCRLYCHVETLQGRSMDKNGNQHGQSEMKKNSSCYS